MSSRYIHPGSFHRVAGGAGGAGTMHLLFIGHLRNKPRHTFVVLTSAAVPAGSEYNTGIYGQDSGELLMSKGGRKYRLRRRDKAGFDFGEVYQARVAPCYQMLDAPEVLHLPASGATRQVVRADPSYAAVYDLYKDTLNAFTQTDSFQRSAAITGSQLQATMSWVIACPPVAPTAAPRSADSCGGAVPSDSTHACSRDTAPGSCVWGGTGGGGVPCGSSNSFGVFMCEEEDSEEEDGDEVGR